MTENTLQMLLYIFEHYGSQKEHILNEPENLVADLNSAGYAASEARAMLDWLSDSKKELISLVPAGDLSLRIFTDAELQKIETKARGFLLFMEQNGVLDTASREMLIDEAMSLECKRIGLHELHFLIDIILSNENSDDVRTKQLHQLISLDEGRWH